ncbi:hypothetical protein ACJX0J_028370, partial [Zea mays]
CTIILLARSHITHCVNFKFATSYILHIDDLNKLHNNAIVVEPFRADRATSNRAKDISEILQFEASNFRARSDITHTNNLLY